MLALQILPGVHLKIVAFNKVLPLLRLQLAFVDIPVQRAAPTF